MILEGKEVSGNIGNVGNYSIDVDAKGNVVIDATVEKNFGHSKVYNKTAIETNIFKIAEEIAKKTETTLDDKAIAGIKAILGIKDDDGPVVMKSNA